MFPLRDWYPPAELQGRPEEEEEEEEAAEIGPCGRVARQGMCMQSQGCGTVEMKVYYLQNIHVLMIFPFLCCNKYLEGS